MAEVRNLILALAATGTSAVALIDRFKIQRVDIWGTGDGSGGIPEVALQWIGDFAPASFRRDISSTASSSAVMGIPPKGSLASFWQSPDNDADAIFRLEASSSAKRVVVDLFLEYVLTFGPASVRTISSTSQGIYYTALDNAAATPKLVADASSGNVISTQVS